MKPFLKRLWSGFSRDDGVATLEFVLVIPLLTTLFMAAFESGLMRTRFFMLEQAVDTTMRELRIGHLPGVDHDKLKTEICDRTVIFPNCENILKIELRPISRATWALPTTQATCVDRSAAIQPVTEFGTGQSGELMLVRVCATLDAMFPTTGIGLALPKDGNGGYGLVVVSAFVNEP
ncbi:pilus assembly protein [Paracoccaceae bacterium Fryx2]|nr:pilus assembly protein [Paracoccaceae bacterium Fryx2]